MRFLVVALAVACLCPVNGTRAAEPGDEQTGRASYYADKFQGRKTASGERLDQAELTAAHPDLPMGSLVKITNLENGRSVVVRVNDRGPFTPGRILDVTREAAERLDMVRRGVARVGVKVLRRGGTGPQHAELPGAVESVIDADGDAGAGTPLPPTA